MKYCIIIPDFRGIGGAQLYAYRRIRHLKEMGIIPFFAIGVDDGCISIDENDIPVFRDFNISNFSFDVEQRQRNRVLNSFINFVGNEEKVTIESTDPLAATWGELFAKTLKCKHILYSLVEPPLYKGIQNRLILDLMHFKYLQGNLIGLSSRSLTKMLGPRYKIEADRYVNISFDTSELDYKKKIDNYDTVDNNAIVIGTISRLEKGYVKVLIEDTILYAKKKPDQKFVLLIIGGSIDKNIQGSLIETYDNNRKGSSNIEIVFLGHVFPLNIEFFKRISLFVGMGTAAVSSISQGCPTIVVDPYLNLSSGILGIDTNNFAYSENGKQYTILGSIEYLLQHPDILDLAKIRGLELYENEFATEVCMSKLDTYIDHADKSKYWNFQHNCFDMFFRALYLNRARYFFKILNNFRHYYLNKFRA